MNIEKLEKDVRKIAKIFTGYTVNKSSEKFQINLNDRPQKLSPETYYKICREYENQVSNFLT